MTTIAELGARLRREEDDIPSLVTAALERIAHSGARFAAFVEVFDAAALEEAVSRQLEWQRGEVRSPLHGIPVAVKDVFAMRGRTARAGAGFDPGPAPARDATVVARLREAGAIVVAATAMHEFGFGFDDLPTRNAVDADRAPGGSSAGSAVAVALRAVPAAVGADSGGSIRIPAAFNGIVGMAPSRRAVDDAGAWGMSARLDRIGPMCTTVDDARLLLGVLAGRRLVPAARTATGLRLGVDAAEIARADVVVRGEVDRCLRVLERAGAVLVPIELPEPERVCDTLVVILACDAAAAHAAILREHHAAYTPRVREFLEWGAGLAPERHRAAIAEADRLTREWERTMIGARLDAVISWATPTTAPPFGPPAAVAPADLAAAMRGGAFGMLANVTGAPAITLPCGLGSNGLPVGLALHALAGQDGSLLTVARAVEHTLSREETR